MTSRVVITGIWGSGALSGIARPATSYGFGNIMPAACSCGIGRRAATCARRSPVPFCIRFPVVRGNHPTVSLIVNFTLMF